MSEGHVVLEEAHPRPPGLRGFVLSRFTPVLVGLISVLFLVEAVSLGIGQLESPAPGMWPAAVSVLAIAAAIGLTVAGTPWDESPDNGGRWATTAILALVVYCAVLDVVGFVPATVLVGYVLTRVIGGAGVFTSVATAVLAPTATYLLFEVALGVPLVDSQLW